MAKKRAYAEWGRQPIGPVGIEYDHARAEGLVFFAPLSGAHGTRDLVQEQLGVRTGLEAYLPSQAGALHHLFGSSSYADFPVLPAVGHTTPTTIAWTQEPRSTSAYSAVLWIKPTGATYGFAIYESAADSAYYFVVGRRNPTGGGADVSKFSANVGAVTSDRLDRFVLTLPSGMTSGAGARLWRNGVEIAAGTSLPSNEFGTNTTAAFRVGALESGADPFEGLIGDMRIWSRVLPDGDAEDESTVPGGWKLYAKSRILVPVSAGGSDIDIAGVVGNAVASGVTGAPGVSIEIASAVGNATAAGIAGSAQVAVEIAGSVGNAVAAGVAGSASVTNDINIDGVVGNAVAAGVAGDTSVGSDISISGTVGNAVAAGTAGVPGVSTTIAATVGNATAAGVSGLAAIGVLIDGAVGNATAAGIAGTLSLEIIISGVVGNAVAAGVSGSVSVAVESETEPTPSVADHSYAVGAMLDVVRERDPREVRRLMRKKHDEAEVLGMIQSLFDQGAFDNETTLQ